MLPHHPEMLKLTARWETRIFLGVLLVGLVFAAITRHAWEDFFIALREAQNLSSGHGLVYTAGERLQSFTSPLGVLIPAAISWITGATSYEPVLWIFRVISLTALASATVLFYQILRKFQRHGFATVFTVLLIALDAKAVDFSINGMETGVFIFFLALATHGLLLAGPRQLWRIGVGFAGLMWTRPDGCIYIATLGLGALIFLPGRASGEPHRVWWKRLLLAGVICAVLYLPWFLWAWWYYGSPVPNSIVAKGTNFPPFSLWELVRSAVLFPVMQLTAYSTVWGAYLPPYGGDEWGTFFMGISEGFAWIASLAWLCPLLTRQARMLSFATYAGHVYLAYVVKNIFPWYWPVVAILGYLTNGLILDQILDLPQLLPKLGPKRQWLRHLPRVARIIAVLLVAGQAVVLVCVGRQMQVLQELVEDGVRRPVGLWLREHAGSPNDTVMLEPLGYVGYFSGLKMYDFVGLASKEMVETRRRLGPNGEKQTYLALKPDWLVLMPREVNGDISVDPTHLYELYEPVALFDKGEEVKAVRWLPGRGLVTYYEKYFIFHRRDTPLPAAGK